MKTLFEKLNETQASVNEIKRSLANKGFAVPQKLEEIPGVINSIDVTHPGNITVSFSESNPKNKNEYALSNIKRNIRFIDLSSFDTSSLTEMAGFFAECFKLKTLDVSNLITTNVVTFAHMFESCRDLVELDVSNFDTSNASNMTTMFSDCRNLKTLDLSGFNTSKLMYASDMFRGCDALETLNISSFDTTKLINNDRMFGGKIDDEEVLTMLNLKTVLWPENLFPNPKIKSLRLNNCPSLTKETLQDLFKKLAVRTDNPSLVLNIKAQDNINKTHTRAATNRGWVVTYENIDK